MNKLILALLGLLVLANVHEAVPLQEASINDIDSNNFVEYPPQMSHEDIEAQVLTSLLPMNMNTLLGRYQKVALVKLAKALVSPILRSEQIQSAAQQVEDAMMALRDDKAMLNYMKSSIDSLQDLYDRADNEMIRNFAMWIVAQYSDEMTARSLNSVLSNFSPAIDDWIVNPVRQYYRRVLNPSLSTFRRRFSEFLGDDVASSDVSRGTRWSEFVEPYVERMTEIAIGLSEMIKATANFLEFQDKQRSL